MGSNRKNRAYNTYNILFFRIVLEFKYPLLGHCFFRLISTFPSVKILFTLLCDQNRIDCKTNAFLFVPFSSIADFTCFAIETHSLPNITFPSEKKTYENKVELTFRIIFEFKFESKIGTIRNMCQLSVRQYDTVTKKKSHPNGGKTNAVPGEKFENAF